MLVTSTALYEKAMKGNFAIPAANFTDGDMLKWHIEVAAEKNLPLILALAEIHVGDMISIEESVLLAREYAEKTQAPIVLHFDHGQNLDLIKKAIDLGFTSVMIDASMDDFEVNVEKTAAVVQYAHKNGVVVEAELGHVGAGVNYENHDEADSIYTRVEEVRKFTEATGVDSLAISIGTAHGLYKGTPKINFLRLSEIRAQTEIPLVLHGGSSSGDENLNRCATGGISKINIFSDFLLAAEKAAAAERGFSYFDVKKAFKQGMQNCLRHYYRVFETK